eukprot:3933120-Rhodomonas_salina.1
MAVLQAMAWVERKYGAKLKRNTELYNSRHRLGQEPFKRGRPTHIDPDEEEKLVCVVEMMSKMKIFVYKETLFDIANEAIKGTEYEAKFPNGVTNHWYYDWLRRH